MLLVFRHGGCSVTIGWASLGLVPDHVKGGMRDRIYITRALAYSPEDFINCGNLTYAAESTSPFTITNVGLQIQLPLVPVFDQNGPSNPNNTSGWIGLLSCSEGSSQEFLGILLTPAGPGYDSSARVSRAQCLTDTGSYQTIVVSPRIAVRAAALETATIIGSDQTQALRWYPFRYKYFVVNQSNAIQGLGYQVMDGTGLSVGEGNEQENRHVPIWDPEKTTLTVREDHASLVLFHFEPSYGETNSKFTIVMRPSSQRAIIRKEGPSEDEQLSLYNYLKDASRPDETTKIMIQDDRWNMIEIRVEIQSMTIHNRQIFELNVDAVQVVDGDISCGHSRMEIEQ